jgi:hypothetical protein
LVPRILQISSPIIEINNLGVLIKIKLYKMKEKCMSKKYHDLQYCNIIFFENDIKRSDIKGRDGKETRENKTRAENLANRRQLQSHLQVFFRGCKVMYSL